MKRRTFAIGVAAAGTSLAVRNVAFAQTDSGTATASTTSEGDDMTDATPKIGYASVNGLEMYYEIHGTGQPLVLLHGGLMTIDLFGQLLPDLARTRQVVAVELQAHGRTADIDRPLSYEQMADDVAALIEQLGLEQVDIFGFSLGGGVALQTTIQRPELVRKLVLAATPYKTDGWAPEILAATATLNTEAAAAMVETPFYEAYVNVAPHPDDWPTLVTKTGQLVSGQTEVYDWTPGVAAIETPTLLIFGDADSVRPEHIVEMFRLLGGWVVGDLNSLPNARLAVLPGTAHTPLFTRGELLLAVIVPFLDAPMPEAE